MPTEDQIAEAEERGYRRGLNEQIDARMAEPAMYQPLTLPRRPSVWDL